MGTHFSKSRGHHCGVMSGHEVMAYTFVSGTQCQPKRRKFAKAGGLAAEMAAVAAVDGMTAGGERHGPPVDMIRVAVPSLSRSPSPVRKGFCCIMYSSTQLAQIIYRGSIPFKYTSSI